VEHYRNSSELGNYIQASKMGQMLLLLPQILASVILPQIAEGINKEFVTRNIIVMSRLLIQLFVVLILLDVLFGQLLFTSVFGNSFYIMNLPFLLLLPGILAVSILTLFSAYFAGKNKVKVDVIGASIALAFVIIFNFSFTNKYGIVAAAIISSVGYSINLGYSAFIFFRTETEYSVKDFLQWKAADYSLIKEILKKN
jgi:O-antigen/teichoic acid export membrane protein